MACSSPSPCPSTHSCCRARARPACPAHPRRGPAAQRLRDRSPGLTHTIKVDASLDSHAIQHVHQILGCDIPGSTFRIRTAAQSRHRAVQHRNVKFQAGQDVRQGLAVCVMEVQRDAPDRHVARHAFDQPPRLQWRADADRVAERDLIAAEFDQPRRVVAHGLGCDPPLGTGSPTHRRRSRARPFLRPAPAPPPARSGPGFLPSNS